MKPSGGSGWNPALYTGSHSFVWEMARDLLPLLHPRPGERILDLGCGTGELTAEIAAAGANVLGLDRSPEMIKHARRNYPAITFQPGEIVEMDFGPVFDAVFSNAALHWVKEADRAAGNIARALKPSGRFVAEFGGRGNVEGVVEAITGALAEFGVPGAQTLSPWRFPGIPEYSAILERHGLEVRYAALFDRPTPLPGGLDTWLEMFGGVFLDAAPAGQRAALIARTEALAAPRLFRDGVWIADYRRIRVAAVKSERAVHAVLSAELNSDHRA